MLNSNDFTGNINCSGLVYCKDCDHVMGDSGFCHELKRKVEQNFFCKTGLRRKAAEPEITRDEKLGALSRHMATKDLKFYRHPVQGTVYLIPSGPKERDDSVFLA